MYDAVPAPGRGRSDCTRRGATCRFPPCPAEDDAAISTPAPAFRISFARRSRELVHRRWCLWPPFRRVAPRRQDERARSDDTTSSPDSSLRDHRSSPYFSSPARPYPPVTKNLARRTVATDSWIHAEPCAPTLRVPHREDVEGPSRRRPVTRIPERTGEVDHLDIFEQRSRPRPGVSGRRAFGRHA